MPKVVPVVGGAIDGGTHQKLPVHADGFRIGAARRSFPEERLLFLAHFNEP